MKELSKKTLLTLFIIFSSILFISLLTINVISYKREYDNINRNISFMDNKGFKDRNVKSTPENMIFMDYEIYTVNIKNGKVNNIINHGTYDNSFDIKKISNDLINNSNVGDKKIGSLYFSNYAYNYRNSNMITILNTSTIKNKLIFLLSESIIVFLLSEILIYLLSLKITKWITKPAVEAFNKQKDFIADASHELKTPLSVIIASSDEIKIDKKNSKYVENIKYESEKMNRLITSMLDLSKIENVCNKALFKEENLSKIAEKCCTTFDSIAYEHEVLINTDVKSDILLNCYRDDIERLINIIIDNAIYHSYKKSTIDVILRNSKNDITLSIINTGEAIKDEDRQKIFERFYRSDKSRSRKDNRYGLGLAIAKAIVNNHNGTIEASSKDNRTTFKIIFKK